MTTKTRVGILIFNEVEILDFCGPYEVFSVTRRQRGEAESPYETILIAATADPIHTRGGMNVLPHATIHDCPPLDILLIPGGRGTRPLLHNDDILNWVKTQATQVQTLTSVCTGALVLAQAGLLDGLTATTHWESLDMMAQNYPQVTVNRDQHWVEQGRVLTSAGISAGIDMALTIVARDHGEATARETALQMEYPYPEHNQRRVVFE